MSASPSRRRFLGTGAAGAAVVAFDPVAGGWLTEADAATRGAERVPEFDGELTTDPAALAEAADDFGHLVHRTPVAVLRPGSVRDVVRLIRYAGAHRIGVSVRGRGHSTNGQSQVAAGVVIDSSALSAVHAIGPDHAVVDAGASWHDLATATLARGLTPPVFTDWLDLSVGGTLSVGGIGGTAHRYGLQVDNVLELEVVTGTGQLVRCSPTRHAALFRSVLGGLGQFAVIVRATVRLVPAPTHARSYQLFYSDLGTYLADQRRAARDHRFSSLEGQAQWNASGARWEFFADAAVYYRDSPPDDAVVTRGLRHDPARTVITEYSFADWIDRLRPTVEFLTSIGAWSLPHPWLDLFLPSSRTEDVVARTLATLTPADTGQGPVLLYPFLPALVRMPFVQVPRESVAFLFSLLRTTVPPATTAQQLAANREIYERARAAGGTRYPVGSLPTTRADWVQHFGRDYPAFALAKRAWDPRRLLSPGQGIFPLPNA